MESKDFFNGYKVLNKEINKPVYKCKSCSEKISESEILEWKDDSVISGDLEDIIDSVKCPECYYSEIEIPTKKENKL